MGPVEKKFSDALMATLLTMFIGLGVWVLGVAWYSATLG